MSDSSAYPFLLKEREDVIFVHITKTAGTSVRKTLDFNRVGGSQFRKHYTAMEIMDLVGKERWASAFTFAFVRNPWDRLFSHYRFKLRKKKVDGPFGKEGFVKWGMSALDPVRLKRRSEDLRNTSAQLDWLVDEEGQLAVRFIGRFENLQEDFAKVCEHIGVTASLGHANQSLPVLHYRDFYVPELMERVEEVYGKDIEAFGYEY